MDRGAAPGRIAWALSFGALLLGLVPRTAADPCANAGRPRIAEVLYDAAGDDTGHEFVELFNPGGTPVALSGTRLEAGDGSGPGRWTVRWTGQPSDTIAPHGRFVIGGVAVTPAPHALAQLDLQNGPDAVRLVWGDGVTEVVGYGIHEFSEYACLTPGPDVPAGQSLARIPDDADLGGNALDFRPATPSPGGANQVRRDLAVVADSLRTDPLQPAPFAPWRLGMTLVNHGVEVVTKEGVGIRITAWPDTSVRIEAALDRDVGAGERAELWIDVPGLPAGRWSLHATVVTPGDGRAANDSARISVRVGPGPLEITEIQFHPAAGEGEWVEVRPRGTDPIGLADVRLSDRSGAVGSPLGGAEPPPAGYAVLVQTRAAFLAHYPALDSMRVWSVAPWPSLNNHDDATGVADVVILRERDGTPIESVPYSAAAVPAGYTLERALGDVWIPAAVSAGTPLEPPRAVPEASGGFDVEPRRMTGSDRSGQLRWSLPWPRARVRCELYDLAGRRRGTPLPETMLPGRGERRWDASGQSPGVYLVVLRARPDDGGEELVLQRPIQIGAPR